MRMFIRTEKEIRKVGDIVLVGDDPIMRQMVIEYFVAYDILVNAVASGRDLSRYFRGVRPCLIILDLELGQDDGLDILRDIRGYSDVPVIMTGHRGNDVDRIVSLELGADVYITKPFNLRELMARVRAVLRRQEIGRLARSQNLESGGYRFNGWQVERQGRRLTDSHGNVTLLTKAEYRLLIAFLEAPHRSLSREQLLHATRVHEDIFDRSIDVLVLRLRRKLELESSLPQIIQTQRGIGYLFTASVEAF